jgi:hypothetical protein
MMAATLAVTTAAPRAHGATKRLPDFPPPGPEKLINFGDDDLGFSAYAMTDLTEQKLYFGLDLTKSGILAIWLSATNRSASTRFSIDCDEIQVSYDTRTLNEAERSSSTIDDSRDKDLENAGALGMAGGVVALPVALPLMLMSADAMAKQDEIKRNLMVKQLYSCTLAPQQSAEGFIYAQLAKDAGDIAKVRLRLAARRIPAQPGAPALTFESGLSRPTP